MYFNSSYLRVITPVTEDGNRPKILNGRQVYKETALPISAKKHLIEQNRSLPAHLKKIIEVVTNDAQPETVQAEAPVERRKPGPKPKSLQNEDA